jgi:hypothetical protein
MHSPAIPIPWVWALSPRLVNVEYLVLDRTVAILIFFEDEGANRGRDGIKRRRNKTGR